MSNIVNKKDMVLIKRIFQFVSPDKLPISFNIGGKTVRGIPDEFSPVTEYKHIDSNLISYNITGRNKDGLEIKVEYIEYKDFPATEYLAFFTNYGNKDTDIISDIKIIDSVINGNNPVLIHGNGDTLSEEGYEWFQDKVDNKIEKFPADGTSCRGAFPYMRLLFADCGINIAIGWPAQWKAEFEPVEDGVRFRTGQKRCNMVIHPGETIRTPRVNFVAFDGDVTRGANIWRRWYIQHILPKENGRPLPPKLCLHVFEAGGHPEFTGADEKNQLEGIDSYINKGLKPDIWWIDAGWYPCNYNWHEIGTWCLDSNRFPHGLALIGKKCEENDIRFLLWFEPERVYEGSELACSHPEWLLHNTLPDGSTDKNSLLNIGINECCDYIINTVDKIIKEGNVSIYRQDFNYDPAPCWSAAEMPDRIGAVENLHVQGYLRFWDALIMRNPDLLIDSCSSGGRRNDLETMRRAVPLHYTDIGYGNHPIKQKQHRQMFEWIPYFRAHNMNWANPETGKYGYDWFLPDEFSYMTAMTPAVTDMIKPDASEKEFKLARKMNDIWKKVAPLMISGDYYPLTECRKSAEDFYVMQFNEESTGKGFFQILSNINNNLNLFTLKLKALDETAVYILKNAETDEMIKYTGKQLAQGVDFVLEPKSAVVYVYEKEVCAH